LVIAAALLMGVSRPAMGQLEVPRATIGGHVRLTSDTTPVVGAEVFVVGSQLYAKTDDHGSFRFSGIVPGRYEVRVRKIGYEQLVKFVTVGPSEQAEKTWNMRRLPQVLSEVRVQGRMV